MMNMTLVAIVLGTIVSVLARLAGGSWLDYAGFGAVGLVALLLLLWRESRRRRRARRTTGREMMVLRPGHPNYVPLPKNPTRGGDGSTD
jgi:membrane protein implicated in regulation of membrane protease activity